MNRQERLNINRTAWDAYQADYMQFNIKERPDFFKLLGSGDVMLDDDVVELAGDVAGLDLLDTCCASDAMQAFSWANLGARVTACDIAPTAIEIARQNALRLKLDVKFHVADAQTLDPISDESQDLVFATYLGWFEDIELAVNAWTRVLRPGGRLLVDIHHPVTNILERSGDGQGSSGPTSTGNRSRTNSPERRLPGDMGAGAVRCPSSGFTTLWRTSSTRWWRQAFGSSESSKGRSAGFSPGNRPRSCRAQSPSWRENPPLQARKSSSTTDVPAVPASASVGSGSSERECTPTQTAPR